MNKYYLDWAVAKALGLNPNYHPEDRRQYVGYPGFAEGNGFGYAIKNYSTDWAHGGPIIERENMAVLRHCEEWAAQILCSPMMYGNTPLIATMRCYVASKLGDSVEIPDELLEVNHE